MEVYKARVLNKNVRKNYNICIAISLFKMDNPYRDFSKYVTKLFNWIYKIPKNYFVRLYTDEITFKSKEFEKIIDASFNNMELFLYYYPEYININGYHDGTFGSMGRFLALFDNDLKKNYNIDYIWISDIDLHPFQFDYKYIKDMINHRADLLYKSKSTYNVPWIPDDVDYPVVNYKMIFKKDVRISKYNFDKFLRDVLEGKYQNHFDKIAQWASYKKVRNYLGPNDKYFIYGFDEIYTNYIMYKELLYYKRLIDYDLSLLLFNKVRTIAIQLPEFELMNTIAEEIHLGNSSRMELYIKLNNNAYEYLKTLPLTLLSTRMKKAFNDYKKYNSLLSPNNNEFAVYLLVNPV